MVTFLDFRGVLFDPLKLEALEEAEGGDDADVAEALFDDALQFLKTHQSDRLVLITSGVEEVEGERIAASGITEYFEDFIYTNGRLKGDVLAEHPEYTHETGVIVDDNPRELDSVAANCPQVTPILMERSVDEESLQIHEFDQVTNLAELDALLDAFSEDDT